MLRCFALFMLTVCGSVAATAAPANGLVVLLTDYGTDSFYVGAIKGAIYTKQPAVRVDTLTNAVPAYDIAAGAALLAEGSVYYPPGTTFCCVVDPGVGTARKCVVLETNAGYVFVGPDNGLLAQVAEEQGQARLFEATNRQFWREGVESTTFQGRDIFGPVSAVIAAGAALERVGEPLETLVALARQAAALREGTIYGQVFRLDPYGNVITDIPATLLDKLGARPGTLLEITIGGERYTAPRAETYASVPVGERLVVVQSAGRVELAINQDSLADAVGAQLHAPVEIRRAPEKEQP